MLCRKKKVLLISLSCSHCNGIGDGPLSRWENHRAKKLHMLMYVLTVFLISKDKCKLIYYIIRSYIISYTVAFKCASINMFSPLLCVQRMYYFQTLWLILLLWLYSSFPSIFPKENLYLDHYTRHLSLYPIEKKSSIVFFFIRKLDCWL